MYFCYMQILMIVRLIEVFFYRSTVILGSFFLFTFSISLSSNCFSQKINIEQYKKNAEFLSGPAKIEAYLRIAELHINKYNEEDSALVYSDKANLLAEKIGDFDLLAKSIILGTEGLSDYNECIEVLENLLLKENQIKDQNIIGDIHYAIGLYTYFLGDSDKALAHLTGAAAIYEQQENIEKLILAYSRTAVIFSTQRIFDKCKTYQIMIVGLLPKVVNSFTKITIYSSLAGQHVQIGFYEPTYLDSAIYYGEKGIQLVMADEYFSKGFQLCNSISTAYRLKNDLKKSLEYLLYEKKFSPYLHPEEAFVAYVSLTDYYFDAKEYKNSLAYLDTVISMLPGINFDTYDMGAYQRVYEYNKELGNYKQALEGLEKFKAVEDSIFNIQNNEVILELNEKYQTDIKNAEISNLQQKQKIDALVISQKRAQVKWLVGLTVLALFGIIIFIIYYRQRRTIGQLKQLETEQQLNRARINPHFFFNAMSSIQGIAIKENSPEASGFIARFSKIMRQSLENTYEELITIEDEIQFITDYLEIQKLRFPEKFNYQINIDADIEIDSLKMPSMLLQPFVENAIEHGFNGIDYLGEIVISIQSKKSNLLIKIEDNGHGVLTKNEQKKHISRALQIINERFKLFNAKHNSDASFYTSPKENQKGFQIIINLPKIF